MFRSKKIFVGVTGILMGSAALYAMTPDTPRHNYGQIAERNLFGLREPAKQVIIDPPPATPPKIVLTGVTTVLSNKLALMRVLLPAKPGEAAKEVPIMLAEGQRDGNIEVLEIREKAGTVKVNDFGTVTTVTFEKEPPTPTPAATNAVPVLAMPGTANAPTNAIVPNPVPAPNPFAQVTTTNPSGHTLPGRSLRLGAPPEAVTPQNPPANIPAVPATSPLLPPPVPEAQSQYGAPQQPRQLTPQEEAILLELERQRANNPRSRPAPQ